VLNRGRVIYFPGGKAIFINRPVPSLGDWACGPERFKDVLEDRST
jgi:hypothetical protein